MAYRLLQSMHHNGSSASGALTDMEMYPTPFDAGELELVENEAEQQGETGEVLKQAVVDELASRLLEVRNEAEFDQLLGGMLSHAAQQVGGKLSAPLGRAVGGLLKSLAKQALPPAGTALGAAIGGGMGNALAGPIGGATEAAQGVGEFANRALPSSRSAAAADALVKNLSVPRPPAAPAASNGAKV